MDSNEGLITPGHKVLNVPWHSLTSSRGLRRQLRWRVFYITSYASALSLRLAFFSFLFPVWSGALVFLHTMPTAYTMPGYSLGSFFFFFSFQSELVSFPLFLSFPLNIFRFPSSLGLRFCSSGNTTSSTRICPNPSNLSVTALLNTSFFKNLIFEGELMIGAYVNKKKINSAHT